MEAVEAPRRRVDLALTEPACYSFYEHAAGAKASDGLFHTPKCEKKD